MRSCEAIDDSSLRFVSWIFQRLPIEEIDYRAWANLTNDGNSWVQFATNESFSKFTVASTHPFTVNGRNKKITCFVSNWVWIRNMNFASLAWTILVAAHGAQYSETAINWIQNSSHSNSVKVISQSGNNESSLSGISSATFSIILLMFCSSYLLHRLTHTHTLLVWNTIEFIMLNAFFFSVSYIHWLTISVHIFFQVTKNYIFCY